MTEYPTILGRPVVPAGWTADAWVAELRRRAAICVDPARTQLAAWANTIHILGDEAGACPVPDAVLLEVARHGRKT